LTRPLIGWWWAGQLYTGREVTAAFEEAGFGAATFVRFPLRFRHLAAWGHIVVAEAGK
jgi:hypothetical protein